MPARAVALVCKMRCRKPMAEQKIFAGPRIRRIRNGKGLTQTAMAEGLGISPSYLNLIERNQRPLTVQLILKLASVYKVEPDELQARDARLGRGAEGGVLRSAAGRRTAGRPGTDRDRRGRAQRRGGGDKAVPRLSRAGRPAVGPLRTAGARGQGDRAVRRAPADRRGPRDLRAPAEPFSAHRGGGGGVHCVARSGRRSFRRAEGLAEARASASSCACCRSPPCPTGAGATTAIRSGCSFPSACRRSISCARSPWRPA